jgi:hypothetical protein
MVERVETVIDVHNSRAGTPRHFPKALLLSRGGGPTVGDPLKSFPRAEVRSRLSLRQERLRGLL